MYFKRLSPNKCCNRKCSNYLQIQNRITWRYCFPTNFIWPGSTTTPRVASQCQWCFLSRKFKLVTRQYEASLADRWSCRYGIIGILGFCKHNNMAAVVCISLFSFFAFVWTDGHIDCLQKPNIPMITIQMSWVWQTPVSYHLGVQLLSIFVIK